VFFFFQQWRRWWAFFSSACVVVVVAFASNNIGNAHRRVHPMGGPCSDHTGCPLWKWGPMIPHLAWVSKTVEWVVSVASVVLAAVLAAVFVAVFVAVFAAPVFAPVFALLVAVGDAWHRTLWG